LAVAPVEFPVEGAGRAGRGVGATRAGEVAGRTELVTAVVEVQRVA
jgi:hypothetical protein